VDPDLVGSSGVKGALNQRVPIEYLEDLVISMGFTAPGIFDYRHFLTMNRVASKGSGNGTGSMAQEARSQGQVDFFNGASGELLGEEIVGVIVFGNHDAAAGFLIQAVDDPGALFASDAREVRAVVEEGIDQGMSRISHGRMDHQTRGFIDHNQVVVFEEDIQGDVFSYDIGGFGGWFFDGNGFPGPHFGAGPRGFTIQQDGPGFDQVLDAGTGMLGKEAGEKEVKPGSMVVRLD